MPFLGTENRHKIVNWLSNIKKYGEWQPSLWLVLFRWFYVRAQNWTFVHYLDFFTLYVRCTFLCYYYSSSFFGGVGQLILILYCFCCIYHQISWIFSVYCYFSHDKGDKTKCFFSVDGWHAFYFELKSHLGINFWTNGNLCPKQFYFSFLIRNLQKHPAI